MVPGTTEYAWVLVPAFAQPEYRHVERVGCIAITPQGQWVRLYPWRFRDLRPEQRFVCGDLIEYETAPPGEDLRPETRYVDTRSVRVLQAAARLTPQQQLQLRGRAPCLPMADLQQARLTDGTSLGVVRPDAGSLRLQLTPMEGSPGHRLLQEALRQVGRAMHPALAQHPVDMALSYRFTSEGHAHELSLLEGRAQATCMRYLRRHADPAEARRHLRHKYEQRLPALDLRLVVSTLRHPSHEFAVVGLLCNGTSLEQATRAAPVRHLPLPAHP
jgi:hypothetical protein